MDALWFAETYSLMPESLMLRDKSGQLHNILINTSKEGKPFCYLTVFSQILIIFLY